jgi:hypothetical protein
MPLPRGASGVATRDIDAPNPSGGRGMIPFLAGKLVLLARGIPLTQAARVGIMTSWKPSTGGGFAGVHPTFLLRRKRYEETRTGV